MANNTLPQPIKLPEDIKNQLKSLDVNIEAAKKGVETLKKLGMDVKQIEDQIKWSEEVRATLLESFG